MTTAGKSGLSLNEYVEITWARRDEWSLQISWSLRPRLSGKVSIQFMITSFKKCHLKQIEQKESQSQKLWPDVSASFTFSCLGYSCLIAWGGVCSLGYVCLHLNSKCSNLPLLRNEVQSGSVTRDHWANHQPHRVRTRKSRPSRGHTASSSIPCPQS